MNAEAEHFAIAKANGADRLCRRRFGMTAISAGFAAVFGSSAARFLQTANLTFASNPIVGAIATRYQKLRPYEADLRFLEEQLGISRGCRDFRVVGLQRLIEQDFEELDVEFIDNVIFARTELRLVLFVHIVSRIA